MVTTLELCPNCELAFDLFDEAVGVIDAETRAVIFVHDGACPDA